MSMFKRLGRLFIIKTRFEAFLVTYAIAVGSIERGQHYMAQYPGFGGYLLALACTGVVFLAGGKLLDSVKAQPVIASSQVPVQPRARRQFSRNRPRFRRSAAGARSVGSSRRG
ncbi:hypothetical protein [Sphingomonas alba]|uniref:hypothetical protein n=1 Tax=Sphingomonas alba TaxID=2908208 RepID=UPI0032AFC7BA